MSIRKWLWDRKFDAMLRRAAAEVAREEEREADEFFRSVENLPPVKHSERYQKAMAELLEQARSQSRRRRK